MGKNIVYPKITFNEFIDEPILKKLALFFDQIYINSGSLSIFSGLDVNNVREENKNLLYEKGVWEYLLEQEIVKTYPYFHNKFENPENNIEQAELIKQLSDLYLEAQPTTPKKPTKEELAKLREEYFYHFFLTHDLSTRLDTIQLKKDTSSEYYPVLRISDAFQGKREKKSEIIQFLLNDIPEPDYNTSWEQIIEFRSDEEIRNKYLALINWVNKVGASTSSLSDIRDEYEFLYNDYMKHFKLHKMKYNNTVLEVVINAGAGILTALQSGEFASSFKNLFQLNVSQANLLVEEAKLPGKEIAYIYHAKQKFHQS